MLRLIKSRLRNQILASMLFVLAIPMLLHYAYLLEVTRNRIIDDEQTRLQNAAQLQSIRMYAEMERTIEELNFLLDSRALQHYIDSPNEQWTSNTNVLFTRMIENISLYDQLRLLNVDGIEVVRVHRTPSGEVMQVPPNQLQDKSDRDYFIHMAYEHPNSTAVHILSVSLNQEYSAIEVPYKPMIRLGTELTGDSGTYYLIANLRAEPYFDAIQPTTEGETVYVVRPDGDYIHATDPMLLFGSELGTGIRYPHMDLLDSEMGRFSIPANTLTPRELVAYQEITLQVGEDTTSWYIIYHRDYSAILTAFNDNVWSLVPLGVLSIVIVFMVALWMAERVASPLRTLTEALKGMGRSADWVMPDAALNAQDEVGDLARAMQRVGTELYSLYDTLESRIDERTQELREANKLLHRVDRQKADLLNNFAHDIRSPMSGLLLKFDLMERRPENNPRYLAESRKQIARIEELLNNVQDIARFDAAPQNPTFDTVDFGELTTDTANMHRDYARENGVSLSIITMNTLPPILGVANMLSQVVDNLVVNAIKYNREGGDVLVRVWHDTSDNAVVFTVADTGRGIPKEEIPHLFKRFYRSESVRQTKIPGTGLGLAIVHDIVKLHGGNVTVESVVDAGTIFTVCIPALFTINESGDDKAASSNEEFVPFFPSVPPEPPTAASS